MQSGTTTKLTATDNTFTTHAIIKLKGAKDLKKYTTAASEALKNITEQFQRDLRAPSAIVDVSAIQAKNLGFKAKMCAIEQGTFAHNISLCHPSPVVSAKDDADKCLANLEAIRKMLVNNKQQKRTTVRQVRGIIRQTSSANAATIALLQVVPDEEHPVATELRGLVVQFKQNHKTVAKNLREQAIFSMRQMRDRILAYQQAAETVIQRIMDRGEKTRAMVRKYEDIALIEFCARAWWFETQKDPMDHGKYTVTALEAPRDDGCPEISASFRPSLHRHYYDQSRGPHSPFQHVNISAVVITVRDDNWSRENPNGCVVDTYYLAESELAKEILNERVIRSFETERRNGGRAMEKDEAPVAEDHEITRSPSPSPSPSPWLQQLYAAGVRPEDLMGEEEEEE
jgi:hypothetical protein